MDPYQKEKEKLDQANAMLQQQLGKEANAGTEVGPGVPADVADTCMQGATLSRGYTLADEALRRRRGAECDYEKANQAARFFMEHPEFDEFIRLLRAGVISI